MQVTVQLTKELNWLNKLNYHLLHCFNPEATRITNIAITLYKYLLFPPEQKNIKHFFKHI